MSGVRTILDELDRDALLRVAHEHMLLGMIVTRSMLPQVVLSGGSLDMLNDVAIDEWMGASPIYTRRMRDLMGIGGDNVEAIMKALQLDVGFVHQYMDVAYKVDGDRHGEFWLQHCGALLDIEPHGEERVFGMCHTIEDPTFDATAFATNPRARIRPIHRPPRTPTDRHPHCHWTIAIDPDNEPVGPAKLTEAVRTLPLAAVPNAISRSVGDDDLMQDYRQPLRPSFRLHHLSSGALAAVAREFQMQSHLLMCSGELALRERFDQETARQMLVATCVGAGWVASERLAIALDAAPDAAGLARVLALHPMVPPGLERSIAIEGGRVHVELASSMPGLVNADHPGCPGVLARGEPAGIEAIVHALAPRADGALTVDDDRISFDVDVDTDREPVREPDAVAIAKIGMVASWSFDLGTTTPTADAGTRT